MIYPNTQPSGIVGGQDDNKRKLQQMLSKLGAAPLFGSSGRSASVASLPAVGQPSLNFNPFLKMLAGRPGETFSQLPVGISGALAAGIQNGPSNGYLGSSVPTTGGASGAGVGVTPAPVGAPSPSASPAPTANPFDTMLTQSSGGGFGHYNDKAAGAPVTASSGLSAGNANLRQAAELGITANNPLYHTLLQLAMYGADR